ncbi:MAG: pyruvate, phosphate dikinase [Zoogloea sp.]|nr:pyruvate, phosphate dikinase [Zoogloea sp.]
MKTDRLESAVYHIGLPGGSRRGDAAAMGFKAWNLARMASLGLAVPEAMVLGTDWCRAHLANPAGTRQRLESVFEEHLARLEKATGLAFGDTHKPLLVSVRSGAPVSMPGMMDTLLNIGLCDGTVRGLLRLTGNPRLVWDSYRRLIQQYAEVVHGADGAPFAERLEAAMRDAAVWRPQELDFRSLQKLVAGYLGVFQELTGYRFPQRPQEQLAAAVDAVFDSWRSRRAATYREMHGIDETLGTAVTVQRMVFGNAGGTSGSGVCFTRDPSTGENQPYLDFLFNSQGEDVVSGRHEAGDAERLVSVLPEVARELDSVCRLLEREFRDVQEFEFTLQDGRLYLLQTRNAKRTPWAALRIAVEQVREGLIQPAVGLARLDGLQLDRLARLSIDADDSRILARAIPAGTGAASGAIALDVDAARGYAATGHPALLVREDITTEDIAAMALAAGVLTSRGSRTAHAAVVARQLGKVCLVGCRELEIDLQARSIRLGAQEFAEGEILTLDANHGRIYEGETATRSERPDEWLAEVERWRSLSGD